MNVLLWKDVQEPESEDYDEEVTCDGMTDEPNANREIIDSSRGHVDAIDVIDVTDVDVIDAKYNA